MWRYFKFWSSAILAVFLPGICVFIWVSDRADLEFIMRVLGITSVFAMIIGLVLARVSG